MKVFKCALEVCLRHPVYLIIYVGFLSLMGLFMAGGLTFNAESDSFEAARAPYTVIDRDQSDLSRAVGAYLSERGMFVEVADEARALQDAVATGQVSYLLIIPQNFGEAFVAAARDGAEEPHLEAVFSYESATGMLVDTQVNQYLGLVRGAAALLPDASQAAVVDKANASAQEQAAVETVQVPSESTGSDRFVFYLKWSAYPLTAAIVVSVGLVMGAFNRTDVRRRVLVSSKSSLAVGIQKLAAGVVVTAGVWAFIMAVGLVAFGESAACLPATTVALLLACEFVYALTPLAIGFLLGQLGATEMVSNAVGNIMGMVFSFLGGAWISLSLLPAGVRAVAAFTPVYWLTDVLGDVAAMGADASLSLQAALPAMGVLALFALAFFVCGLVAGRLRAQSAEAGGNAAAARPR